MTTDIRRRAIGPSAVTILLLLSGLGWISSVAAAEGQLTQIGGNGPTTCNRTLGEIGLNQLPPPPGGISGGGFRSSPGISGIASDLHGGLYMAYGSQVFDLTSTIAGVHVPPVVPGEPAPPPGRQDDGAPAVQTDLSGLQAIAAHPLGGSVWVALAPTSIRDPNSATKVEKFPGRIRRLNLTEPTRPVRTVATIEENPAAMAADGRGNVYVADESGAVYMLDPAGTKTVLTTVSAPTGIAVDVTGSQLYVSSAGDNGRGAVYRVNGPSLQIVAGGTLPHNDSGSPNLRPRGLAIGHETDGQTVTARYLYIADDRRTDLDSGLSEGGRVVRVDLKDSPPVITTVAGGGTSFASGAEDAKTANLSAKYLAADMRGQVYIAASDQCAIFKLQTPSPFRLPAEVMSPPGGSTNNTLPPDSGRTNNNQNPTPDPAPSGSGNLQVNPGTGGQTSGQGTQTQIVPGSQTQIQPQPPTELRVIDQGTVVNTPEPAAQPTVEPVPTPGPTAQFTPTPAPTPTPTPAQAPTPADVSTAVAPDPSPSSAAAADAAAAAPPAPAAAPVPPAPAAAPPPAAQQPVSNVGLAHGDSAAPSRGATRYAMVRNDEEQSLVAALAMAGAGAIVAVFLCVMFVAPGASSKPKPRPKGAY